MYILIKIENSISKKNVKKIRRFVEKVQETIWRTDKKLFIFSNLQAFENNLQRQKAAKQWLSRSSELLDLSSGDSRDTPGAGFDENNQQSGSNNQGLIPQIVMNPWGSEAPMMTFAVQAYQHQWLLQVGLILLKINLINQRILA